MTGTPRRYNERWTYREYECVDCGHSNEIPTGPAEYKCPVCGGRQVRTDDNGGA